MFKKWVTAAAVTALLLTGIGTQAQAQVSPAAEPRAATTVDKAVAPSTPRYCVSVIGKATSPGQASVEEYRYCSSSPFDSAAQIRTVGAQTQIRKTRSARLGGAAPDSTVVPLSSTHLFRAYEHEKYQGQWWDYYGSDGPCDQYGYRWNPDDWWQHHLSSLEKGYYSNCSKVELHTIDHKKWRVFDMSLDNLTPDYNDNVGYLQVYNG